MVYIYKITNIVNGKFYIGSTKSVRSRWAQHKHRLNKCIHANDHLQSAWNKYGKDAFIIEVIAETTPEDRNIVEKQFINSLGCLDREVGYNIKPDADARSHSPETIAKIKASCIGRKPTRTGAIISSEQRSKQSESMKGRKMSDEQKAIRSVIMKERLKDPAYIELLRQRTKEARAVKFWSSGRKK